MPLGWQWQLHVSIQKVWKIHFVDYRIPLLLEPWRVSWSWSSGEKTQNYKHLATTTWCKIKREKHLATRVLGATLAPTSAGQATAPEAFVLQVFDIFLIIWNGFVLKCDFLKICLAIIVRQVKIFLLTIEQTQFEKFGENSADKSHAANIFCCKYQFYFLLQ